VPRVVNPWVPVVAWAFVIFVLSSFPSLATGLGLWDVLLRKGAHLMEFAILGALLARATGAAAIAFALGVAYAGTDELHQHFVPGRDGNVLDVGIDAIGVLLGVSLYRRWRP
jgi:VanZ family protein